MATATGSLLDDMEVEEQITVPLRGRGTDPDLPKIVEELKKCLVDRNARSFKGITKENREPKARLIRKAGEIAEIEVTTRLDEPTGKLYWGPSEVMSEVAKRGQGGSTKAKPAAKS
jgi:hypothetical protein